MTATIERVLQAMQEGKITRQEADIYLKEVHGTSIAAVTQPPTSVSQERWRIPAVAVMVLLLAVTLWLAPLGDITGRVVSDLGNGTNETAIMFTGITASGTLTGEGFATLWFDTPDGPLLIANISSDLGVPRTAQASYLPGELVEIEHAPVDASYYLDDGTTSQLVTIPFLAPETTSTLLIISNGSGSYETVRIPVVIGDSPRTTVFTDACVETCDIAPTTGEVRAEVSDGATLEYTVATSTTAPNTPPALTTPFDPMAITGPVTIDLAQHYTDADGDPLLYTTGTSPYLLLSLDGSVLTLTPVADGEGTLLVYASDLEELVEAGIPYVVTLPAVETNATENVTVPANDTNVSVPVEVPVNTTNVTVIPDSTDLNQSNLTGLDCSDPDPNSRPLECIQDSSYFKPEQIIIESKAGVPVGQLTPIGNLLIKGGVVEYSVGSPVPTDYQLGYNDQGDFIPTLWIDTQTGDLHLRGSLSEQNDNLQEREGYSAFINKRGIILALYQPVSGDLIVRGNVVPYRRSFG